MTGSCCVEQTSDKYTNTKKQIKCKYKYKYKRIQRQIQKNTNAKQYKYKRSDRQRWCGADFRQVGFHSFRRETLPLLSIIPPSDKHSTNPNTNPNTNTNTDTNPNTNTNHFHATLLEVVGVFASDLNTIVYKVKHPPQHPTPPLFAPHYTTNIQIQIQIQMQIQMQMQKKAKHPQNALA